MASTFKNTLVSDLGTSETLVYNTASTVRATFIGMSLANKTNSLVLANIRLSNSTDSAYYVKNVAIPPNTSLRVINGGEKLILTGSMNMYVSADTDDSLDLVASYVEIV